MPDTDFLILITNDDGLYSPGLWAAVRAVQPLGELLIAAPRWQQPAAGRSMMPASYTGRIHEEVVPINGRRLAAFGIEGPPAQAVRHALLELAPRLPDLVVSGINYGENVGNGITTSGTVGAAMDAAAAGVTGLAVSLGVKKEQHLSHSPDVDFGAAAHFTAYFAHRLLQQDMPFDVDLLKLDVPSTATAETPWRLTRVSRQRYFASKAPPKRDFSQPGPLDYEQVFQVEQLEPDSDIYAFAVDQIVSVSPLSFDLTARVDLAQLGQELRE